jgi:CDP-diacylglycerol--glycerol-3-phosphate 3-phosphatidyltransferase
MSLETESVSTSPSKPKVWSLPNQITVARVALSIVLFVLMSLGRYAESFVVFVLAASTDWLDGYFARRWGLVTQLGRILDPFADKLIICGTFTFLAAIPQSRVPAWAAVVIMGRELLVTALRSFLEQRGRDFSAEMSGKLKMLFQCFAAGGSLFYLAWSPSWLAVPLDVCLWIAIALTLYSGATYVRRAVRLAAE